MDTTYPATLCHVTEDLNPEVVFTCVLLKIYTGSSFKSLHLDKHISGNL